MKYRYLGRSGLLVSRICLGTMTYGNADWGCDQETSTDITRRFIEAGGNFIDTADLYSAGVSEEMLGVALKDQTRDDLVIATKCWFPTGDGQNARALSRKHIIEACDASLKRLGTNYIDLYQIHGPDPYTPVGETMRALDDLVRSGKVRYVGCSNIYGWQVVKANAASEAAGMEKFISGQYLYNAIRRDIEREILPACDDQGMGLICWSPLASGLLTGKYRGSAKPAAGSRFEKQWNLYADRFWFEDALNTVDLIAEIGEQYGKSPAQVSLAWLLGDERVTAPIIGARSLEQLEDNLEAGDWDLPSDSRDMITNKMPFDLGYPKEWMKNTFKQTFGIAESAPRHEQRLP